MDEKDRFLRVISGGRADRIPFIVPGFFWTHPPYEITEEARLQKVEKENPDARLLSELSLLIHDRCGIENLSLPFAMRLEAAAYGVKKEGRDYPLKDVSGYENLKSPNLLKGDGVRAALECISVLSRKRPYVPVIADVHGPLSLSTSLMDAGALLRALVKDRAQVHGFLTFLLKNTIEYARALVDAGATAVFISDPLSTSEILGRGFFAEFALPYINAVTEAIHNTGSPVIVHLCGNLKGIKEELPSLKAECISVDSAASIKDLKSALPKHIIMGNLNALVLSRGSLEDVKRETRRALSESPHILSSSCALTGGVIVKNLKTAAEAISPPTHPAKKT